MGSQRNEVGDNYVLATGDAGAARLEMLDEVYGPATKRVCLAHGLSQGWRVADFGCGTGRVSCWFGERVGLAGQVTGLDVSPDQIEIGREGAAQRGLGNVSFLEGSAYEPGLPHGQFDLVFCRFLLIHLQRPADALRQMTALLRPGGVLIAQESIMTSMFTDPPTRAYERFAELSLQVGEDRGVDYDLGSRLFGVFRDVGLTDVDASIYQPCFATGEHKRLWEYTFLEASLGVVESEIFNQSEFDELASEFAAIGTDDTTLVVQPCLVSVSGTAPR
jgi:SAM-dependent methyltransferase